ncbi:integumentary mucin C.1-like, partial [Aethina tumida]|uniref:integumentary mucin C.1-like n=1 Tax=Aethina tumida TaxID=116153 RepID=UPI0021472166
NDPYCQSYFLCNLLRNGTFIKTLYNCPKTSFFDPSISLCSTKYVCQCSVPTTVETTTSTESPTTTTIAPTSTTTDLTTTTTTTTTSSTTNPTSTTTIPTTTVDPCKVPEEPEDFECTAKGRFKNPNDPYCQSYFLCNLLRNGTFIKTLYNCPKTSFFDQSISLCSTKYVCQCSVPTTVQTTTSTKSPTTTTLAPTSTTSALTTTTTTTSTTPTTTTTSTTTIQTTTSDPCKVPEEPKDFECTAKGRFKNPNDPYCQSYFLCNLLRNGTFIKTLYNCPKTSFFDQSISLCSTKYVCQCSVPTTVQTTTSTKSPTTTTLAPTSTTSALTTTTTTSSTTPSTTTSPTSTTTIQTTTADPCKVPEEPKDFECTAKGRFKNPNDPYCQSYFLCNLLRNGTFIKTLYNCPKTSFFDQSISLCSTKYVCQCSVPTTVQSTTSTKSPTTTSTPTTTTKSLPTTTIVPTTTTTLTTTTPNITTTINPCKAPQDPEDFVCTAKGRFKDPNDPYCQSYILCTLLKKEYIKTPYTCPKGSFFNPSTSTCSTKYICECSETTTLPTIAETDKCQVPSTTIDFQCAKAGRYQDPNDPYCTSYYKCTSLITGKFTKTQYNCPSGTYFDSSIQMCNKAYVCPCISLKRTLVMNNVESGSTWSDWLTWWNYGKEHF